MSHFVDPLPTYNVWRNLWMVPKDCSRPNLSTIKYQLRRELIPGKLLSYLEQARPRISVRLDRVYSYKLKSSPVHLRAFSSLGCDWHQSKLSKPRHRILDCDYIRALIRKLNQNIFKIRFLNQIYNLSIMQFSARTKVVYIFQRKEILNPYGERQELIRIVFVLY